MMSVEEDKPDKTLRHSDTGSTDSAVSDVHEQAKVDHQRDHNHTVAQSDTDSGALANGRRGLAHKNPSESLAAQKKKDKDRALLRTALKQLLDRLETLFEEISAINERLQEIDNEIQELEHLKELTEKGLLDPTHPDHAKLLKKYGITQEDIVSGNLSVILAEKLGHRFDERTELQKRKESLQHQANEAIAEAKATGAITPEEADQLQQEFRQRLQSLEAGVSAVAWDSNEASQELKEIASQSYSNVFDEQISSNGFSALDQARPSQSVAASLEGDASYKKGIQSMGKNISIKEKFAASTDNNSETTYVQIAGKITITPDLT